VPYLVLAALAAGSVVLATPLVRALAFRLGALDLPAERRLHVHPVPRLGGLAVARPLFLAGGRR